MQRFRWVALQGSARGLLSPLLLLLAVHLTTSGIPALAADDPAACPSPFARIVSIQGSVEVLRPGQSGWVKVTRLDTPICEGDRLRTGAQSRAALFIQPETLVRVDQHTRISLSQTAEETLVEFIQDEMLPASATPNACGAGYFITRFPRKFKVNTPHLNAAVEGTEFLVAMRCEATDLSVFEGKVLAASAGTDVFPPQTISSGQTLTIGGAEPPAIKLLVKPADAVQWVLYYPPLSDARAETDLPTPDQCRSLPKPLAQTCLSQHAELLMRLGQIDEAQREIDEAVALDSQAGEADALRAVILIARNDKTGALEAATSATVAAPNAYRAWLALSYAQQADFKLEDSLESAKKAQSLEPNSSLTNARVAELLMSLGRIKEAERAALAAVDANPQESRARTVLGFVRLAQIKTKAAREDFQAAIERDSSDPLPRLGLGLAIIRDGNLVSGRQQIEIAVALDPTNSLLRSYVGKAYYEENTRDRESLAVTQFGLAKQLDPNDPTPWFYNAIVIQAQNRPGEASIEFEESISRNDNREVVRSRLQLDQDNASRSANAARIYRDLGFTQLTIDKSREALLTAPDSFAGHRMLADAYANVPRLGNAKVSELLQTQLLAPANAFAVQPQLGEANLLILERTGPPVASFQEFNPLFERDRFQLLATGVYGNRDTWGNEFVASALKQGTGIALGQFHHETGGTRPNDDLKQDVYSALIQKDISFTSSFQVELRRSELEQGDVVQQFDPRVYSSELRETVETDVARLGLRHQLNSFSTALVSIVGQKREQTIFDQQTTQALPLPFPAIVSTVNATGDSDILTSEFQLLSNTTVAQFISGFGYSENQFTNQFDLLVRFSDGTFINQDIRTDDDVIRHRNAYLYSLVPLGAKALVTIGVSFDSFEQGYWYEDDQANHKLGLTWQPTDQLKLRAASFRYMLRDSAGNATLEPTQVAGFNQLFDDANGTDSKSNGVGFEHSPRSGLIWGGEYLRRSIAFPSPPAIGTNAPAFLERWIERIGRAHANLLVGGRVSLGFEYLYELQQLNEEAQSTGLSLSSIETKSASVIGTYHRPTNVFFSISTTFVDQTVGFLQTGSLVDGHDSFWVTDMSAGFRLPRRLGTVSINAKNLFDKTFQYQDTNLSGDPRLPLYQSGRSIWGALTVSF